MKVWFIADAHPASAARFRNSALAQKNKVITTLRDSNKLGHLKAIGTMTLTLYINGSDEGIQKVIWEAVKEYGTIDILMKCGAYI